MNRLPISLSHGAIIVAAAFFLTAPHFLYGYPSGHSAALNVSGQHFFYQQLLGGELYPRWLTDYPDGLGAPIFYYYAPLPFYFASLFGLIGCFNCSPALLLSISHLALFAFSGIAFYFWCARFASRPICLVASLFYVTLPYHYLDLEIRNAIGEGAAFVWLPLIFSGLHAVVTTTRSSMRSIILTAIAYAALILSHLPSALLVVPFMAIYVGVFAKRTAFVQQYVKLAAVGVTGVLLSAIYLAPALLMRDYLQPDIWINQAGTHYMPEYSLLFSGTTPQFGMLVYADLAIATLAALAVVIAMGIFRRGNGAPFFPATKDNRRMLAAALISFAVIGLMITPVSRFMWVNVDILRQVQFPWRLGVEINFWAASALAGGLAAISEVTGARAERWGLFLRRTIMVAAISTSLTTDVVHMIKYRSLLTEGAFAGSLPADLMLPREYHSIWAVNSTAFNLSGSYYNFRAHIAALPEIAIARTPIEGETISMDRVGPSAFQITASLAAPAQITARQAYFPTWKLNNISTGAEIPIVPSKETGLISATLTQGKSEFSLSVKLSRPEKIGAAISALAAGFCLVFLVAPILRSWRQVRSNARGAVAKLAEITASLRQLVASTWK